mgnify:CR=1 FL=1
MNKILFVASEFAPGMIPFASNIIKTLSNDERFDVYAVVVNSGRKSYSTALDGIAEGHLVQVEYPRRKVVKLLYKFLPVSVIRAVRILEREIKPDVLHLLTGDFTLAPYLFLCRPKRNWFYTVHDLHPHEVKSKKITDVVFHKYVVWGYKRLRDNIVNLTTSSRFQYEELKRIYPYKHVSFTHFPSLLTLQIINGEKQVVELLGEDGYILFFGVIDEYKGVDLLIKAYESSLKLQRLKLVIAGRGCDIFNYNPNIIRINRFIDDTEVKDLFSKALFVVYPYKSATMSGVLSIAYFFKKKVLLSSIPFFIENATPASAFFQCGDVTDLRAQMEKLVLTTRCYEDKCGCYDMIYSEKTLVEDYKKLYSL